jgi:hypothetical protein
MKMIWQFLLKVNIVIFIKLLNFYNKKIYYLIELRKKLKIINHDLTENDIQFFSLNQKDVTLSDLYNFLCCSSECKAIKIINNKKAFLN